MKKTLLLLFVFSLGCNNKFELNMERGIQYYEWDMIEESILEFKKITHTLGINASKLDYSNIKLLARAHHNLAVAYAKKQWYAEAIIEAKKAFMFYPSDENKQVLELIKTKYTSKEGSKKKTINP